MSKNQLIAIDAKKLEYVYLALQGVNRGLPRAIQGAINTSLTATKNVFYA